MFYLFLLLMSCGKQDLIKAARTDFAQGVECLNILKAKMQDAGCNEMQVERRGDPSKGEAEEILMRCYKDAGERGKFWDNYVFRITHAKLEFADDAVKEVREHTICIDKKIRIEAYKP